MAAGAGNFHTTKSLYAFRPASLPMVRTCGSASCSLAASFASTIASAAANRLFQRHVCRIQQHSVCRRLQRRIGAIAIPLVAGAQIADHFFRLNLRQPGPSCSNRRSPRTSGAASRKIFTSACGKTTVPMSRPSITTPPSAPNCCCKPHHPCANGREDTHPRSSIGHSLIAKQPGHVLAIERGHGSRSSPASSRMMVSAASSSRVLRFVQGTSARSAFRAKARYMAPVSRFRRPKCRARCRAIVLLPAPAGPSMATITFRLELPAGSESSSPHSSALLRLLLGPRGKAVALAVAGLGSCRQCGLAAVGPRILPLQAAAASARGGLARRFGCVTMAVPAPGRRLGSARCSAANRPCLCCHSLACPCCCTGLLWLPFVLAPLLEPVAECDLFPFVLAAPFELHRGLLPGRLPLPGRAALAGRGPLAGRVALADRVPPGLAPPSLAAPGLAATSLSRCLPVVPVCSQPKTVPAFDSAMVLQGD